MAVLDDALAATGDALGREGLPQARRLLASA
jgi:hypothetical protein